MKENQYFKEFSEQFSDVRDENNLPLTEDAIQEIYQTSEKRLVIKLERESSGIVNVSEDFSIENSNYPQQKIKVTESSIFRSEADSELKNVCIFYYPNYNSTSSMKPLDVIEFENKNNYPVNLFVVKQKTENFRSLPKGKCIQNESYSYRRYYEAEKSYKLVYKSQLCAQLRVCSQAGGIPVYPRFSQPDNSESWDDAGNGI